MRTVLRRLYARHVRPTEGHDSFPSQQLFVLALCRICEPIAFMSIFPYAYRMIESFNLTTDESTISIYAGALITAFAFAEFSTGVIWGRISDRVGRKPVLIMGLVGTCLSMICFGFSRSLSTAILSRALGGLLNGNVGVLQTTVAELVTKKEHQPRAYSIMPFVWCLGSIIGPAMGGALAMPCEAYPWLFPKGSLFDTFPFLLPNLVCVVILFFGITNGILFLEETHAEKRAKRDHGREMGQYLVRVVLGTEKLGGDHARDPAHEEVPEYDGEDLPPGYRSTEGSPRLQSSPARDVEAGKVEAQSRGIVRTFNKQVVFIIVGYGILAYHSVSFDSLMPTFLSEDRSHEAPHLPFKFSGGFGLTTKTIGFMMAIQGIYSMVAQLWFFPYVVRRFGTLKTFRAIMLVWPFLYLGVPYLVLLPARLQMVGVYFSLLAKITLHVIAFPSSAILLTNAAPSRSVLGTINGVAASTACLARAFGPTVTGAIHSYGLKRGYAGPAWWFSGLVCAVGAVESFCMTDTENGPVHVTTDEDEQPVCEPLLHTTVEHPDDGETRRDSLSLIDGLDLNDVKS